MEPLRGVRRRLRADEITGGSMLSAAIGGCVIHIADDPPRFIRELLDLWSDRARPNSEVRAVALKHVAGLETQAQKLQGMS